MGAEPARSDSDVLTRRMRALPLGRGIGSSGGIESSWVWVPPEVLPPWKVNASNKARD